MTDPWLDQVTKQLTAILALEANWDGDGALAPDPEIIERANRFAGVLESHGVTRPQVVPTRAGGVQFEWNPPGGYCELVFLPDREMHLFADNDAKLEERSKTMANSDSVWAADYVAIYLRFAGAM
jgi:hypothetical protein